MRWAHPYDVEARGTLNWTNPATDGRPRVGIDSNHTPLAFRDELLAMVA